MAKIKKLPSGNYRMQVQKDGIRKSFTASTKNQVMLQAAEWLNSYVPSPEGRPLIDVVGEYISKNETVLSPSTINGYSIIYKRLKKYDIAFSCEFFKKNIQVLAILSPARAEYMIKGTEYLSIFFKAKKRRII